MAGNPLETLSLNVLTKMQKDFGKMISAYEDRQNAKTCAKVASVARWITSLVDLIGMTKTPPERPPLRNADILRTRRSPDPLAGEDHSGSWKLLYWARRKQTQPSVEKKINTPLRIRRACNAAGSHPCP